jgi:hypothetical protein
LAILFTNKSPSWTLGYLFEIAANRKEENV